MIKPVIKTTIRNITPPIILQLAKRVFGRVWEVGAARQTSRKHIQAIESDKYIAWVSNVLGGFLSPGHGNIAAFDYAIEYMPTDGAILEIGSFLGKSTNLIAYLTIKHSRKNRFFSCDPWQGEGHDKPIGGYFDAGSHEFRQYCISVFSMNMEMFSKTAKPYTIESSSDNFLAMWQSGVTARDVFGREITLGGPISFAHVDGAHTYEAVRHDFQGIDRYLVPGGFILFDDTADDAPFECKRVMPEILSSPAYELVFRTPNYFFRKKQL